MNTYQAAEKVFPSAAFPQRLEAAVDFAAVTARVELVPFQTGVKSEFFRSLLWHSVSGRRNLRPAPRHERQVVAPE